MTHREEIWNKALKYIILLTWYQTYYPTQYAAL